ncbi:MAG: hypothetical protein GXY83_42500 [Rhodopirellula sp.]|nr:hypothetical protein [Rhodopirellula sp.]
MRSAALLLVVLGLTPALTTPAAAADQQWIQPLLDREIVGDVLPLAEVQKFCEERVPVMKSYPSADAWQAEADRLRAAVLEKIVFRGQAAAWRDAATKVEWLDAIAGGPGYRIKKFRYEALPGLWIPGLLYEPEKLAGKVPAILNVNGHSPEGKAYVPKQMRCINQAKRGMLAMNVEWLGMGQLRAAGYTHYTMNQIDLCGASGLAPFYLCMKRALDILTSLENADPERIAVTGLSGGGWQTITISSLDTRVKLSTPVAGYSSFRTRARYVSDLGDSEQTPNDLATLVDYTHLTAMMAPRPTLLVKNAKDNCCFASPHALPPLLEAAAPIFKLFGREEALRWHVNDDPGTHNYEIDNRQAFYRMLRDFFYAGQEFDAKEIPSEGEVKTAEQLEIPIPADNETFNTLARALSESLPRGGELPADKQAAAAWQQEKREDLKRIVHAKDYTVYAIGSKPEAKDAVTAVSWRLQMGGEWTVPAVEFTPKDATSTVILVADGGRKSAAANTAKLLDAGCRVLAIDPFYFGESKISQRDFLYALLVAGVGERPLGLQASQVAAVARWAEGKYAQGPVALVALGPRSCTYALVAAALEPKAIGKLEVHNPLGSLKEIIEQNGSVNEKPELFCFGLLESFDIRQMAALVAPRTLMVAGPSERAKAELSALSDWYRLVGGTVEIGP